MTLSVRRVVTGHDDNGRAVVTDDRILPIVTRRPGQLGCNVWAVNRVPVTLDDPTDRLRELSGSVIPNGVVFRVVRYEAGSSGRLHRTSSMDFAVVLSGSIELDLDEGARVALGAGDLLVQRGTIHNWVNRSSGPCTIAFVILHANGDQETVE